MLVIITVSTLFIFDIDYRVLAKRKKIETQQPKISTTPAKQCCFYTTCLNNNVTACCIVKLPANEVWVALHHRRPYDNGKYMENRK